MGLGVIPTLDSTGLTRNNFTNCLCPYCNYRPMTNQFVSANKMVPLTETNTYYEWELENDEGEWQAGGSANSLDDVKREGMRYLQTYAQDGPHKLIIRQHCTETIDEITNG